ncbi:hypothetical protein Syun_017448 [Stephania yunnanensis]|uniref:Uncharacterized protein n=1 Tax=Stephania yunnanensis TaxID=152371 RepID=A0AAP0P5V0_9MAGN
MPGRIWARHVASGRRLMQAVAVGRLVGRRYVECNRDTANERVTRGARWKIAYRFGPPPPSSSSPLSDLLRFQDKLSNLQVLLEKEVDDDEDKEEAVVGYWSAFVWLVGLTSLIALLSEYVVDAIEVPLNVIVAWINGIEMDLDFKLLGNACLAFAVEVPIIDYNLVLFFQPLLLLGITIGVTLSIVFPFWLVAILIVTIYSYNDTASYFFSNANRTTDTTISFRDNQFTVPAWSFATFTKSKAKVSRTMVRACDFCAKISLGSKAMTKLLRIYGSIVPNCRRDPIIFEETQGNLSSDGEVEFEDEENYVNFDKLPKFDDDDQGFIEDTAVVFGDESRVVTRWWFLEMKVALSRIFHCLQVQAVVNYASISQCSVEVVERKEVEFIKHFCSLTKIASDVDFDEVSLDFLDHTDLEGLESVIEKFVLFSIIELVKLSFEEKIGMSGVVVEKIGLLALIDKRERGHTYGARKDCFQNNGDIEKIMFSIVNLMATAGIKLIDAVQEVANNFLKRHVQRKLIGFPLICMS